MFDPFGDFATEGYLRNFDKEKDPEIVKIAEHELFRAQLPQALDFLAQKKRIEYSDFLKVHQILFDGLYPWAGKDRTMLLIHAELCFRAKMSVNWMRTDKQSYLDALTQEIESPNDGHLDAYLKPFIEKQIPRENWLKSVSGIPGLDGIDVNSDDSSGYADPVTEKEYLEFERRSGYQLKEPNEK